MRHTVDDIKHGPHRSESAVSAEQLARNILERMDVENAQTFSAGDVVELANLIADREALSDENERLRQELAERCESIDKLDARAIAAEAALKVERNTDTWRIIKLEAALADITQSREMWHERWGELEAALTAARQGTLETAAKIADQYPDTLDSIGAPGSGTFRAVSKAAAAIRALAQKEE